MQSACGFQNALGIFTIKYCCKMTRNKITRGKMMIFNEKTKKYHLPDNSNLQIGQKKFYRNGPWGAVTVK